MRVHVKTPHIKIDIEGEIPESILAIVKKEYGKKAKIDDDDNQYEVATETEWYKELKSKMKPGDYMKGYRISRGMTQVELGKKLGSIPRQHISNMEKGIRKINIELAKKLAEIFEVSIEKFI
jgi:DNA-binding XRE family transcriptional regulator